MIQRRTTHDAYAAGCRLSRAAACAARRLAFQALEDRTLFSIVIAQSTVDWQIADEPPVAVIDELVDLDQPVADQACPVDWSWNIENEGTMDGPFCLLDQFDPVVTSPGSVDSGDNPAQDLAAEDAATEDTQDAAGKSDSQPLPYGDADASLGSAVAPPTTPAATAPSLVPTGALAGNRPEVFSAAADDGRPRMLDIGRAADARRHTEWQRSDSWPLVDQYFQRLDERPVADARLQHAAARDEFNSFVLGSISTHQPATQIEHRVDPVDRRRTAVPRNTPLHHHLGVSTTPAALEPLGVQPADIASLMASLHATAEPLADHSLANVSLAADRLQPESAMGDKPDRTGPPSAAPTLALSEARIWPFGFFAHNSLMRTACIVGFAMGLAIRSRRLIERRPEGTAPPA